MTDSQKRLRGETRPSKMASTVVSLPLVAKYPDPPDWVNDIGCELWAELVPLLMSQRVLADADLHAMAHLCQLHGEIVDMCQRRIKPHSADRTQLRLFFAEFGLTSASRTRVGGAEPGAGNKFKDNGRRPE